jgi:hypothetical protein
MVKRKQIKRYRKSEWIRVHESTEEFIGSSSKFLKGGRTTEGDTWKYNKNEKIEEEDGDTMQYLDT